MTGPLDARRIVVTRPVSAARRTAETLARRGAIPILLPLIEIVDPPSWTPLDDALRDAARGEFDWIVVTSVNGADRVALRIPPGGVARGSVAAVGTTTAARLEAAGIGVDLVPRRGSVDALAAAVGPGRGRLLLVRVADGPQAAAEAFAARGWDVHEVAAYRNLRTAPPPPALEAVRAGRFEAVTFFSPSAIAAFVEEVSDPVAAGISENGDKVVACIGETTAGAARAAGVRVDVLPDDASAEAVAEGLARWFATASGMAR